MHTPTAAESPEGSLGCTSRIRREIHLASYILRFLPNIVLPRLIKSPYKIKNPDAVIGGIVGEYKHTEPESGRNAISGALREALHQGSKIVIIDVQSDVNYQDAWNAINGRIKGKDDIEVYFKLKGNETIHLFKKK